MNQKLKLLSIGSLVLTLLSFSDAAFACECVKTPTPCVAYERAEAVFIGTPTEVSRNESKDKIGNSGRASRIFRFSVDQAFRGVNDSQVSVITGQGAGDCGYDFKIGEQYLVYASRDSQKMLYTSICSRTKHIRDANEDLEYIHGLSKASPGGWVFGEVFNQIFLTRWGSLISLGALMRNIYSGLFGTFVRESGTVRITDFNDNIREIVLMEPPLWCSWAALFVVCAICLALLAKKVKAYEVVR